MVHVAPRLLSDSSFCFRTFQLLQRRDPRHADVPYEATPPEGWGPVLFVAEVLEQTLRRPSWDLADAELVLTGAAAFGGFAVLDAIARETVAFRRWLHAEGLGSDVGIASLDELAARAPAMMAYAEELRGKAVVVERLPLAPRRERRVAARAERKRQRRSA